MENLTNGPRRSIEFSLQPLPPFRLDLTVWALRRRLGNTIDRWDDLTYRRVLSVHHQPVEVAVQQIGSMHAPTLQVEVIVASSVLVGRDREIEIAATAALERLLGIDIDLTLFYEAAQRDLDLSSLADRFLGLKPPRFPTLFETLVNAIACQQVTLTLGIRLLNSLAESYGLSSAEGGSPARSFPDPESLANQDQDDLRKLAFSRQKARAIIELAGAIVEGRVHLDELASLDDAEAVARLQSLRGVGRWTAEYVLLRGFGRLHVFPGDDVGARNNLKRWLAISQPLDYTGIRDVLARFHPFAGLVYLHLLLDRLQMAGYLAEQID